MRIALLSALITMLTFLMSSLLQFYRDGKRHKQERLMKIIDYKIDSYRKIYNELLDYNNYFLLFVDTANEFKENEEPENFAPLESNIKLRNVYEMYRLFFSKQLERKLKDVLESGEILNNLAITLCNPTTRKEVDLVESVLPSCENVIEKINSCILQIKKELYVESLY